MGLFSRRGRTAPAEVLEGKHELCVVGESFCQDTILKITGPKTPEGFSLNGIATLQCDPTNPYDRNAVGVYIDGGRVGYLPRDVAAMIAPRIAARRAPCHVRAQINGGWKREDGDEGHCGVVLHMPDPEDI